MKSISVISTQIQLINTLEFLSENDSIIFNDLIVFVTSKSRMESIRNLLDKSDVRKSFMHIHYFRVGKNKFVDFISFLFFVCYSAYLSLIYKYDYYIIGNYRLYLGRLLYALGYKSSKLIVLDDGLATIPTFEGRIEEIRNNIPYIFKNYKYVLWDIKYRPHFYIPRRVSFFSIYSGTLLDCDDLIENKYKNISKISGLLNIPQKLNAGKIFFLGQPIYNKGIVSYSSYADYLRQYYKISGIFEKKIFYYAHPEESEEEWKKLNIDDIYIFEKNDLSFEVVTLFLQNCTVASFFTSALPNIKILNSGIKVEAIYLNEIDDHQEVIYLNIRKCYIEFAKQDIFVHRFAK